MNVMCLCRCGFEKEVASEITDKASEVGINGFVKTQSDTGFVQFVCLTLEDAKTLITRIPFSTCVFIRHWFITAEIVKHLPKDDRATPLLKSAESLGNMSKLEPITLDTNDGKALRTLTKGLSNHLRATLKKQDRITTSSKWVGQCLFLNAEQACIGIFPSFNASIWAEGIPRLRAPKNAPSRATLKLEEAWHQFIPKAQWDARIAPSMRAVDLGAAPGGWTWQLVNKSMFIDAVDNGPMDKDIMESGQVTHHLEDAYKFVPGRKVHWLVSDIADKPARVAELMAKWAKNQWFGEAIFNLKLPMKKRYNELMMCQAIITQALQSNDIQYSLQFKQLYHDREEVTGHLMLKT